MGAAHVFQAEAFARSAFGLACTRTRGVSAGEPSRAYNIDANDQLRSAAEYKSVVIAYKNGAPVFLSDVASVLDDAENARLAAWMNEVRRSSSISSASRAPTVIEVVEPHQSSSWRSCRPPCRPR